MTMIVTIILITGGDDVQQLCEAGEEEFLEIMMLVDMASKPLHVRRLQKALQEWVQNPGKKNSYSGKNIFVQTMDNYDDIRSYVSKFCPSVWDQLFILAQTEIILLD